MSKKPYLCIVGTSPSTTHKVPQQDPLAVVWGCGASYKWITRCGAWFEMHSDAEIDRTYSPLPDFYRFLETLKVPIIMTHKRKRYPTSVAFPLAEATGFFGVEFFHSTFDYMLALGIMQMAAPNSPFRKEIRMYGIDMYFGGEYAYQVPSAHFYIGQAMARGIKVIVPGSSSLLSIGHRYGYDEGLEGSTATSEHLDGLVAEVQTEIEAVRTREIQQAAAQGRLEEARLWAGRGRRF